MHWPWLTSQPSCPLTPSPQQDRGKSKMANLNTKINAEISFACQLPPWQNRFSLEKINLICFQLKIKENSETQANKKSPPKSRCLPPSLLPRLNILCLVHSLNCAEGWEWRLSWVHNSSSLLLLPPQTVSLLQHGVPRTMYSLSQITPEGVFSTEYSPSVTDFSSVGLP